MKGAAQAILILIVTISAFATHLYAATIHVPANQPTIRYGIDAAADGDTVLVADGTYYEHDIAMKSGVYLSSESGEPNSVTIDAQQQGRVFYCNEVEASAKIVGFKITGSNAVGGIYCNWSYLEISNCIIASNHTLSAQSGGGLYCERSSPTLTNCTFEQNSGYHGGGVFCNLSSPTFVNCRFEGNTGYQGGGMFCKNSDSIVTGCTFDGNQASDTGGGIYCEQTTSTVLSGCVFLDNSADHGGAVFLDRSSHSILDNCTLSGNHADDGGGVFSIQSPSTLIMNSVFEANSATSDGGAMYDWSSASFIGCTFTGNSGDRGGALYFRDSAPSLTSCIIALCLTGEAVAYAGSFTPTLTCCDIYGNVGGDWLGVLWQHFGVNGNFSADPQFCGIPGSANLYLQIDSPCAPGNHPSGDDCGLIGAYPVNCGNTSAQAASWSKVKSLY